MLKPSELKQAQGFPKDFELEGTTTERTAQIGNAILVNTARSILLHALSGDSISLAAFGGRIQDGGSISIPNYKEFPSRSD